MKQRQGYKSSLLVAVLSIAALFSGCGEPTASTTQNGLSNATAFVGNWYNMDLNTRSITRVRIRELEDGLEVSMWGRCQPSECPWGEEEATIQENGNLLTVTWDPSFAVMTQNLRLQPDGTLTVSTHTHFTDESGRMDFDSIDQFAKGA